MYIRRIYLKNFTGIYSGTGLSEIDIKFPNPSKTKSRIILFMGKNGSGKSTVLSSLHPFASSFDDRDESLIRAGMEGEKIVEIVRGKDIYKAVHYIDRSKATVKTKSFLYKNDVVLNTNGLVGSFHEVLFNELGLEESFFRVGRIVNSGSKNFVDLTAGQRKDFISAHLPDLEPWMIAFKESGKKCLASEKTLKFIANEIDRLPDKDKLIADRTKLEEQLKTATKFYTKLVNEKGKIEAQLAHLRESEEVKNAENILNELEKLEESIDEENTGKDELITANKFLEKLDLDLATDKITSGNNRKLVLETEYKNIQAELTRLQGEKLELSTRLASKRAELNKFSDVSSIDELKKQLETSGQAVETNLAKNKVLRKTVKNSNVIELYEKLKNNKDVNTLRTDLQFQFREISNMLNDIMTSAVNIDVDLTKIDKNYDGISKDINEHITKLESEIRKLETKVSAAELLKDRPEKCKIDSCPFIVQGIEGEKLKPLLQEKKKELTRLKKELIECDTYISLQKLINKFRNHITRYKNSALLFQIARVDIDHVIERLFEKGIYDFIGSTNPEELCTLLETYSEITTDTIAYDNLKEQVKLLQNNDKFVNSLRKDVNELSKTTKTLAESIAAKEEESEKISEELIKVSSVLKKIVKYKEFLVKLADLEKVREQLKVQQKKSEKVFDSLNEKESRLAEKVDEVSDAEKTMDDARTALESIQGEIKQLEDYETRKAEFEAKYNKQNLVRNACDPKKGLPLAFMKGFLDNIKDLANSLFEIAFNGRFLVDFIVTEKEFRIQVEKDDGDILSDVKLASDGERAFIKTIISLSLLSCYTNSFPILSLDEVDAVLDSTHRTSFADIIETQIQKLSLGQVFVISHNEEFRNDNVSVVLFPGHTLNVSDKNSIIASFS